jgi:glycosyltransferase involved in cell wall biosynthesis
MKAHAFFLYILDSPLYRWGFSMNKLFDYLACGRPVLIAANTTYNPVAEAKAGLTVLPGEIGGIVAAMKQLTEMPVNALWEMGQNARRFAEENHDFDKLAARLESVLQSALEPEVFSPINAVQ